MNGSGPLPGDDQAGLLPIFDAQARAALAARLETVSAGVEAAMDRLLPPQGGGASPRLTEALRYAVFAGGKRLRPFLIAASGQLFDVPDDRLYRAGAAVEFLHTYSLVHDDLPAMDDDDLRRGRPTTHRQYDEATAVLVGDALLTLAFQVLAEPATHPDGGVRADLVLALAEAGGAGGMVGGQMLDIEAEAAGGMTELGAIGRMQRLKTGALIEFSCRAGAILSGAGMEARTALRDYARALGLAYQIADDLIDATGDATAAGKAVGKDAARGKATFVGLMGVDGARAEAARLMDMAIAALGAFDDRADDLRRLAIHVVTRDR
ncbi:farnesyl-diphosphate synthase [Tistrella bauzanensis]|uniref:Farnesyl-diphosphate synthase n=2 Tax=Tistrella bauzanensis TaxID=657419 RepID=A0ABQ1J436_9PROT|nr:farnesyl-diphosphate synthase [Tistrella bauzanensis]